MRFISLRILFATLGGGLIAVGIWSITHFTTGMIILGVIQILIGLFLIYKARYW